MVVILLSTDSGGAERTPLPRRKEVRFVRADAVPSRQAQRAEPDAGLARAKRSGKPLATAGANARRLKAAAKKMGAAARRSPRRVARPSTDKAPGQDALGGLGKLLSPKNFDQSMDTISNLRSFCKQCIKYVQQADGVLDTLFVTGNSLKETGVLKKIAESKGKNLSTDDLTNILLSLMNSPLGATFFQRIGSGKNSAAADTAQAAPALPESAGAPVTATVARPRGVLPTQGPLPPTAPLRRQPPRTDGRT